MSTPIEALRQELRELQERHDGGTLDAQAYTQARGRIEREIVEQVMRDGAAAAPVLAPSTAAAAPGTTADPAAPRASRRLQVGVAVAVLVVAALGYSVTGSPGRAGIGPAPAESVATGGGATGDDAPVSDAQVTELVDKMAQRLKEKPDDAVGWALLARAYSATGRIAESLPAYQKALALAGDDPNLMADYADAMAAQNKGRIDDAALQLITRALAIEPGNVKALALSGSAAFDQQDYASAVRQWEKIERALPPDSSILAQVRASIVQARSLGGMPPAASATTAVAVAPATAASAPVAVAATAVSGSISLAPAMAARASPDDTVFVLARAAAGPRMPLAVLRKQVKDLPLTFTLDDSMAMAPTAKISDHAQVIVIARVSKSGDAMPQPGDLVAQSSPVAPGTSGITLQISEAVGK